MQAAQIDPAKLYALTIREGKTATTDARTYVARFKVHMVESHLRRRHLKPTSADYEHKVFGHIDERDVPPDLLPADPEARRTYLNRAVDPAEIEDEYTKYQELIKRVAEEKAASEAREAERKKQANLLVGFFYGMTGLEDKPIADYRGKPFEVTYSGGVGISEEGVKALNKAIVELTHQPEPADK